MLWTSCIDLEITSFSKNHIDYVIGKDGDDNRWRLTDFYGAPEIGTRYITFGLLKAFYEVSSLPWLCMGGFNELISHDEKVRGDMRSERQMNLFRDAISSFKLFLYLLPLQLIHQHTFFNIFLRSNQQTFHPPKINFHLLKNT